MFVKDLRMKLVNEVLSGIKILKLYGWEPSFEEKICSVRDKESSLIRKALLTNAVSNAFLMGTPIMVSTCSYENIWMFIGARTVI